MSSLLSRSFAALACCLISPVAAQAPIGFNDSDESARASCAAFFFRSSTKGLEVFGQFEVSYPRRVWKAGFAEKLRQLKAGTRFRLATFDTSCPIDVDGKTLPPGFYRLALEPGGAGKMALVFVDAAASRAPAQAGGSKTPMQWRNKKVVSDKLGIELRPSARTGKAISLVLRFGTQELWAKMRAVVDQPAESVRIGAAQNERRLAGLTVYGKTPRGKIASAWCGITYGSPRWKAEYDDMVDRAKPGTRFRLGDNFFATLDTNYPATIGGTRIPPGVYYLALEKRAAGQMALVLLDPQPIRKRKLNSNQTSTTTGGHLAKLDWRRTETTTDRLQITMRPLTKTGPRGTLTMRFGNHELTAPVVVDFVDTPPTDAKGWTDLFDGKSLAGWTQRNGTATYRVEGDSIVGETTDGSPNSFLCTDKSYGDFELTFEVKAHNQLNSGVQIRSQTRGGPRGRVNGPQVEIEASGARGAEAGYLYGEAAGGWMTPKDKRQPHKHFKDGEWNHYRVLARGANIKVWVNGVMTSDLTDAKKFRSHPRGFIGLQVHGVRRGAGPFDVRWRKLRIRE